MRIKIKNAKKFGAINECPKQESNRNTINFANNKQNKQNKGKNARAWPDYSLEERGEMEVLFRCDTEHLRVKDFEVRMTTFVHSFLATRSHVCTTLHQQGDKEDKLSLRVASTFSVIWQRWWVRTSIQRDRPHPTRVPVGSSVLASTTKSS